MPDDRLIAARAAPARWRRALRPLLWLALACAVVYAVGGAGSFRQARRWVRAVLRPPTPAEIQRVDTSASAAQATAAAKLPSGADYYGSKPPSALTMAAVIVGVIGVARLLALATGRRRRHRAPRSAGDRAVG